MSLQTPKLKSSLVLAAGLLFSVTYIASRAGGQEYPSPEPTVTPSPSVSPSVLPGQQAVQLHATLNGSEETPPVTTNASGDATAVIKPDRTIDFTLSYSGLTNIQGAHIHFGQRGFFGPILFTLSPGSFTSPLTGTLTEQNLDPNSGFTFEDALVQMLAGNTYVNIHTQSFPDGEIRGQLEQREASPTPSPSVEPSPSPTTSPTESPTPEVTVLEE